MERFCYNGFLRNSSRTKFFVCLREVSALEDVRFTEVPLYSYFNYKTRFNGVSSRNNLPRKKVGAYVINLHNKKVKEHIGIHYLLTEIQLYILILLNFEYIPQEILNKIKGKSIPHNIFRIQDNDFIMCGFYCTAFIKYMLAGKTLSDYTNIFSPNNYKKNGKITYKYFKDKYVKSRV